jgi:hypothetical protein
LLKGLPIPIILISPNWVFVQDLDLIFNEGTGQ